jgi:hypothetical protein
MDKKPNPKMKSNKHCTVCGEKKQLCEFPKDPYKLQWMCNDCKKRTWKLRRGITIRPASQMRKKLAGKHD